MTIHGTGFVFFVSMALLFGALCGYDCQREDGNTPAVVPIAVAIVALVATFVVLISRGLSVQ